MAMEDSKKFTKQAKSGIKGEAYFEFLTSDYCIPHHVTGQKDLGIDYFCEWVFEDKPTGVLFAVQVKTFAEENITIKYEHVAEEYNGLKEYRLSSGSLLRIEPNTICYWRNLAIPIY